jgi:hypothetical protein
MIYRGGFDCFINAFYCYLSGVGRKWLVYISVAAVLTRSFRRAYVITFMHYCGYYYSGGNGILSCAGRDFMNLF